MPIKSNTLVIRILPIKKEMNEKVNEMQKQITDIRHKYNQKIIDQLKTERNKIVEYQFSPRAVKEFEKFADQNKTDAFVVLNPLYGYAMKGLKIKPRNLQGAFGGGQFNIYKKGTKWQISEDMYDQYLGKDWSKCNLSGYDGISTSQPIGEFNKQVKVCTRALTDDLTVLKFIDKLGKTHPQVLASHLEY